MSGETVNDTGVKRFKAFMAEFVSESDRGCAVLSMCVLEEELTACMRLCLSRFSSATQEEMMRAIAPPGSWRVLGLTSQLMGFISPKVHADLKILINVRNQFAHKAMDKLTFSSPEIVANLKNLSPAARSLSTQDIGHRATFLSGVGTTIGVIAAVSARKKPIEPCAEYFEEFWDERAKSETNKDSS